MNGEFLRIGEITIVTDFNTIVPDGYFYGAACETARTLFIVLLIVFSWCSRIGFALGYILLAIGAQHVGAASELTLVGYRDFLRPHFKQPGPPTPRSVA